VLKKCREQPEDVLFIDASAYFEKAKNQNFLRDEDVNKIIATYRGRLEEQKYSYRARLAEIEENDFNLNIPRYVDTFEDEEEVDLAAVAAELRQCDQDMVAIDQTIKAFCDELGIESPV
jgi:type I restriction enzyme M protein